MKKAKTIKKLELAKETLRQLDSKELQEVAGRGWSDDSVCPTMTNRCP